MPRMLIRQNNEDILAVLIFLAAALIWWRRKSRSEKESLVMIGDEAPVFALMPCWGHSLARILHFTRLSKRPVMLRVLVTNLEEPPSSGRGYDARFHWRSKEANDIHWSACLSASASAMLHFLHLGGNERDEISKSRGHYDFISNKMKNMQNYRRMNAHDGIRISRED